MATRTLAETGGTWRDPATQVALLLSLWVLTRIAVVVGSRAREHYPYQEDAFDVSVFASWGAAFAGLSDGPVPLQDTPWEYPAAAAALVVAPTLATGAPYVLGFVGLMALADLAGALLLSILGLRRGSLAGAWLWVATVPLLGPVALTRYDVVPSVLAAGGLAAATGAAPLVAGLLLAAGGALKLWPALLLPLVLALHRGATRMLAAGAVLAAVVVVAVAVYGGLDQLFAPLTYQRDRGIEIEALIALPLLWRALGGSPDIGVEFAFGAYQVTGPEADVLMLFASAGMVGVVIAVAALTVRLRRSQPDPAARGPATVCLAVLLVAGVLVFDKVLSAQYPLWLAALVALGLCWPGSPLRMLVPALCLLLLLTQVVYPLRFLDLVHLETEAVALVTARNALVLVVALQAAVIAWRATGSLERRQ